MNREKLHEPTEGYKRAIKYMGIFGGLQGLSLIVSLVKNKVASKLLGAAGLGIIAAFNRTLQLLSDCTNLSLSFSAVKKISESYCNGDNADVQRSILVLRSWVILTAVIGTIFALALSPLLGELVFEGNSYYTSRFVLLAPVVGFMAVTGGELAILKAVRQLSKVAVYTFLTSVCSLIIAIPLYYYKNVAGIFPAIFFIAFMQMVVLLRFSLPLYTYKIAPFSISVLKEGLDMVKLGIGYVFAAILGSGSIWIICRFLLDRGNDEILGLYSCGYFLMGLLPGIIFAALDSDYYPRLSAVSGDLKLLKRMVNEQAEIQLLFQTPILIFFMVALPILLPLLYKSDFSAAVPMTQLALFGMFIRTMTYPMSYLPLAKGESVVYLFQESIYDLMLVVMVLAGYHYWGLTGTGVALSVVCTLDWLVVYIIASCRYNFRFSKKIYICLLLQLPFFLLTIFVTQYVEDVINYWIFGSVCILISTAISFRILWKQTNLLGLIFKRVKRIIKR